MNRKELESKLSITASSINALWDVNRSDREFNREQLDAEHNRISVLAPKVDNLEIANRNILIRLEEVTDLAERLLAILQRSGILEEAVEGNDLFQMQSTVDMLRRYPLYRINKVVTK